MLRFQKVQRGLHGVFPQNRCTGLIGYPTPQALSALRARPSVDELRVLDDMKGFKAQRVQVL